MSTINASEISNFPDLRGKIDSILAALLNAPINLGSASNVARMIDDISEALDELVLLAKKGMELAIEAEQSIASGQNPNPQLAEMEDVDKRLLAMRGREMVSFLMQPIILELSSSKADGEPLENSKRLYSEIANSAGYHRCCLDSANWNMQQNIKLG